jgi:hypothetical protein
MRSLQPREWQLRGPAGSGCPLRRRITRSASGTTLRFILSYGAGMPSKHLSRLSAANELSVFLGSIEITVRRKTAAGAR